MRGNKAQPMPLRDDSPRECPPDANWRAAHGGLLLLLLGLPAVVPGLAGWPWPFLAPLLAYGAVVAVVPPLRRSLVWFRVGRLDPAVLCVSGAIALVSSAALVLYDVLFRPDLRHLAEHLPTASGLWLIGACLLFATTNALLEELVNRGILQDALESQLGASPAVIVQAVVFGVGHAHGYPPGELGIVLAASYGLSLGMLRLWAGGLAAPFLTHIGADVTIFILVMRAT